MNESEEPQLSKRTAGSLTLHDHSNVDQLSTTCTTGTSTTLSKHCNCGTFTVSCTDSTTHLPLHNNGNVNNLQELHCGHSEELSLRQLQLEPLGLLELVVEDHRDVHNRKDLLHKTLLNQSWETTKTFTRPAASRLSLLPAQEPPLGLLSAALHECNVDRSIFCTGSGCQ